MDLESILFTQGFGSRRRCRERILGAQVAIDGKTCLEPEADFDTRGLCFTVAKQAYRFRDKAYLMLHKPAGFECSHQPHEHASVYTLLPAELRTRSVECIGRLDVDTTGLLLLSDDGQFIHRLASPRHKVAKVYVAGLKHPLDEQQLRALREGVLLRGESRPSAALAARALQASVLELTLAEGKYHQVKRMVAAAGNRVETLHRQAIGSLELPPSLKPGAWRFLEAEDLARLQQGSLTAPAAALEARRPSQ